LVLKLEKEENQKSLNELNEQNLKLNEVIDSLNSKNIDFSEELDFWTNKTKSLEENVVAYIEELDNLKDSLNTIEIENCGFRESLSLTCDQNIIIENKLKDMAINIEVLTKSLAFIKSENFSLKEEIIELSSQKEILEKDLFVMTKDRDVFHQNYASLESENIKMKKIIDEINAEKESLKQEYKLLNENFSTLKTENFNLKVFAAKLKNNEMQALSKKYEESNSKSLLKVTNIWGYKGLRVKNVNIHNRKALIKRFSEFGKLKGIESVKNLKTSVWIYYDNPLSPVEAIAHLQSSINSDINYYHKGSPLPLRMFFAPTNDQTELKDMHSTKTPKDNGECLCWRTTECTYGPNCQLLHIPANKGIDAQIWMTTKLVKHI
jgi:chromosome segregation ATPase